jgi:hypothetical protein
MVTPAQVEPIAAPGFQAKHDAWQTEIHRATVGVAVGKGAHKVA